MTKKKTQALQTQLAAHEVFGQFRFITTDDGEIYFVAVDVCKILGYKNSRKALADHVDDEDKRPDVTIRYTSSNGVIQSRKVNLINESGLYSLIFNSKLPAAKKFTRWVTSEVLPSIRKTGSYNINKNNNCDEELTWDDVRKILNDLDSKGIEWDFELDGFSWELKDNGEYTPTYKIAVKVHDE